MTSRMITSVSTPRSGYSRCLSHISAINVDLVAVILPMDVHHSIDTIITHFLPLNDQ